MAEVIRSFNLSNELVYLRQSLNNNVLDSIEADRVALDFQTKNLEQIKDEARDLGYHQGYSEGVAYQKVELQTQITQVQELLNQIPIAIAASRQQLSTEIADIVLIIVQQFFINQQISKEAIAHQINQTLTQINDKQEIELLLNPRDMELLQQGLIHLDLKTCKGLRIVPNEQLRLGGCQIKSEHGLFDAGIERQIDNLKQLLLQIKTGEAID